MLRTTLGQLLVNSLLPRNLRDYNRQIDKGSLNKVLSQLALESPEEYRDVSHRLAQLGINVASRTGGFSFGPQHLKMSPIATQNRVAMQRELDQLLDDESVDPQTLNSRVIELAGRHMAVEPKQVYQESLKSKNPLALQILSGSRGNTSNLASLLASSLLFADAKDEPVPIAVTRSYSQGLTPSQYWAATYGGRRSVMTTKLGIAQSGYMGKQLVQAAHRLLVSAHDGPYDPNGPIRGLPADTDDADNEGSLLAHPIGGHPRNTILTPRILKDLQKQGVKRILVRSPTVGGPEDGGIYARDAGIREFGRLPTRYEQIGISAGQSIGERLCAAEGTLVRMADGTAKRIEHIEAGDMVLGCSRDGVVRPTEVLALWDNGKRACIRTVFRNGTGRACKESLLEFESTPDHRILSEIVIRGGDKTGRDNPNTRERRFKTYWNPVDVRPLNTPMKSYDHFCARMSSSFDDHGLKAEPYAMLIGALLGDGCYTGCTTSTTLRCFDHKQIVDLVEVYGPLGFEFTHNKANHGSYTVSDTTHREVKYREDGTYYRNRIKGWLEARGMWGKYSYEKTLPPDIHSWDNASVAAFVSGYLATDGYVAKTNSKASVIGFDSTSKKLLRQLRRLLQIRFGVRCTSISKSTKKGMQVDGEPYRPCYKFAVAVLDSLRSLHAVLKIPGVKQRRFDRRMRYRNANSRSNASLRAKRVSTESIGMKHTYDLYVAHPDHLFLLANGLVVHNSQVALSSKHSGGVAGGNKLLTGMPLFQALINTPKTVKGGAAHAVVDGRVEKLEEAPAGGQYVWIGDKRHYVSKGFDPKVKVGDTVEAGDVISDGIPNPSIVVQHKGIGEGRRYFTKLFSDSLKGAGIYSHRRNVELLARGLINHVELNDEIGEGIPGDIMPYQTLESTWEPRAGAKRIPVGQAQGRYLERPILHYSIGTPIRPSVVRDLQEFGIKDVDVHDDPPPFQSTMVRADTQLQHDPDFMTRMYGSHIRKSFLSAVHRGGTSDRAGTSFVPGLAYGVGFGQYGKVQTPETAPPHPGWATGEPHQTEVEEYKPSPPKFKAADVYHGSPSTHETLKPSPSGVLDGESAVFASPNRAYALSMASPWSDEQFEHRVDGDQIDITEKQPGELQRVFDRPGTIHHLPDAGFLSDPRIGGPESPELINRQPITPIRAEQIHNLLAALRESGVRLHAKTAVTRIDPSCPLCPKCGSDETVHENGKAICYACEHSFGGKKTAAVKPNLAVTFDRPKGTKKTFNTPDGKREVTYPVDYGYFDDLYNPEDDEEADVFVGTGDLCGRFMKGDNLSGTWKPDERKWYVGMTPEELSAVFDMYRDAGDKAEVPSLIRDHIRFDDINHLENDVKLLPQKNRTKEADWATLVPILAMLGAAGIYNMPAIMQFLGLKDWFKSKTPENPQEQALQQQLDKQQTPYAAGDTVYPTGNADQPYVQMPAGGMVPRLADGKPSVPTAGRSFYQSAVQPLAQTAYGLGQTAINLPAAALTSNLHYGGGLAKRLGMISPATADAMSKPFLATRQNTLQGLGGALGGAGSIAQDIGNVGAGLTGTVAGHLGTLATQPGYYAGGALRRVLGDNMLSDSLVGQHQAMIEARNAGWDQASGAVSRDSTAFNDHMDRTLGGSTGVPGWVARKAYDLSNAAQGAALVGGAGRLAAPAVSQIPAVGPAINSTAKYLGRPMLDPKFIALQHLSPTGAVLDATGGNAAASELGAQWRDWGQQYGQPNSWANTAAKAVGGTVGAAVESGPQMLGDAATYGLAGSAVRGTAAKAVPTMLRRNMRQTIQSGADFNSRSVAPLIGAMGGVSNLPSNGGQPESAAYRSKLPAISQPPDAAAPVARARAAVPGASNPGGF